MINDRSGEINHWENLRFVFMDEMLEESGDSYVSRDDEASYVSFAIKNLLGPLAEKHRLDLSQIIRLPELDAFSDFEMELDKHGGLDLLILATGAGGHFAQVVPGTPLEIGFHIADLNKIPGYAAKHEQGAYKGATFRDKGMSLGHRQVIGSKNIVLMLTGNGADKIEASTELFKPERSTFTEDFPISILYHPEVAGKTKVFVSKEALFC
jgi:6-phosphogluconolactonase/glucosamine-6-phosphate isomerase/deaminase